ncbi:MAG: sugar ABC transporter substrate-binding protein [Clostridiales bacterium]|nr:sugar ABC transporter substrate-binding protein [Clostridiales bacterium]
MSRLFQKPFFYFSIIVVLLAVFYVQTISTIREMNTHEHASISYDYKYHFTLDLDDAETYFAREFLRGANEKANELNIAIETRNVNSAYDDGNMSFVQWAAFIKTDAVITCISEGDDADTLENYITQFGVPCCIVYNELSAKDATYVGPNNYLQGYKLALTISKKYADETLHIGLLYSPVENKISNGRIKGFLDGLKACGNIVLVDSREVPSSYLSAMGEAEDMMLSYDELNYFVCLDENLLAGAIRGIIDLNKVLTIHGSGIGYSEEMQGYISNGIIDFAIDSEPYEMGRQAVQQMYNIKSQKGTSGNAGDIITDYSVIEK